MCEGIQTWNLALRLNSQNQLQVTTAIDGHLPSLGWSLTIPRMVTHHSYFGHEPSQMMVTNHLQDGQQQTAELALLQ